MKGKSKNQSFFSFKRATVVALTALLMVTLNKSFADNSVGSGTLPEGIWIAKKINERDEGISVYRTLKMQMIDHNGKIRERLTNGYRKYFGKEKRTVLFYKSPRNVKGTGFLTIDYPEAEKEDDQWIYLPAMRKVRRISAAARGDYFMGTDFTYDEIKNETKVDISDYTRVTLREEILDGNPAVDCYVVESTPVSNEVAKEIGFSKMLSWVDKDIWMIRKSIYWDLNGNLLKTIRMDDIRKIQGIWTTHKMRVENHKSNHKTVFTFDNVDYGVVVDNSVFNKNTLKRGL